MHNEVWGCQEILPKNGYKDHTIIKQNVNRAKVQKFILIISDIEKQKAILDDQKACVVNSAPVNMFPKVRILNM